MPVRAAPSAANAVAAKDAVAPAPMFFVHRHPSPKTLVTSDRAAVRPAKPPEWRDGPGRHGSRAWCRPGVANGGGRLVCQRPGDIDS